MVTTAPAPPGISTACCQGFPCSSVSWALQRRARQPVSPPHRQARIFGGHIVDGGLRFGGLFFGSLWTCVTSWWVGWLTSMFHNFTCNGWTYGNICQQSDFAVIVTSAIWTNANVYAYMFVCSWVSMRVFIHICVLVCVCVCSRIYIYIYIYRCIERSIDKHVCTCKHMHDICIWQVNYLYTHIETFKQIIHIYIKKHLHIYTDICICIQLYMYIYIIHMFI